LVLVAVGLVQVVAIAHALGLVVEVGHLPGLVFLPTHYRLR
jgi:hypothetical protein